MQKGKAALKYLPMILTGWKEICQHLRYGMRTVQRWERLGLPVKRITNNRRSPVVADSEELDAWILHRRRLPQAAPKTLLDNLQRVRELQREVAENRKELQVKLETLRKQIAEFHAKRRRSSG